MAVRVRPVSKTSAHRYTAHKVATKPGAKCSLGSLPELIVRLAVELFDLWDGHSHRVWLKDTKSDCSGTSSVLGAGWPRKESSHLEGLLGEVDLVGRRVPLGWFPFGEEFRVLPPRCKGQAVSEEGRNTGWFSRWRSVWRGVRTRSTIYACPQRRH